MRRIFFILTMALLLLGQNFASAAPKWGEMVNRMEQAMNQSLEVYNNGDATAAKKMVNDVYYGIYEKEGFETAVRSTVSSKRAALTEYKFSTIKKLMTNQAPPTQIKKEIDEMLHMMREDVQTMTGGKNHDSWQNFWPAFLILVREGVEAILVIGAILAYLTKSGNERKLSVVYYYSAAAILASFLTAILLQSILGASGASQEILEGCTMLFAVAVLFSVSCWMGNKADQKAWGQYIEGKVKRSLSSGNTLALGLAAFLAVYREGAEVVLFYQALFNEAGDDLHMIWLGFAAGCLALAVIFAFVRYGTLKIPLKPFFQGTSILMAVLAVSFAGGGMKELQEGGVVGITPLEGMPIIDLLGVYPTWETLLPQLALILLIIASFVYQKRKGNKEAVST